MGFSIRSGIIHYTTFLKTISKRKKNRAYFINWHSREYSTSLQQTINDQIPIKMKISDSPEFHACLTKEVLILKSLFAQTGHEIRIVGGAVRDLLLGIKPEDLDFATTATPEEMKGLFTENGVRLINNRGEKHGTITARINEKNFEVTTLRVDLQTDGRHAEVKFTTNWLLDANRRDLTINSMYLDLQGNLYDYFNGYEDLKEYRIRFVGKAEQRIQEDYLRILRYFRFYGKIAREPDNHLEEVLEAIRENAGGLENISGERIWMELHKICTGKYVYEILEKIIKLNVGKHIGIPVTNNLEELKNVCERLKMNNLSLRPMTLLSALFQTEEDLETFYKRIKPSTLEKTLGLFVVFNRHKKRDAKPLRTFQQYIINSKNSAQAVIHTHELLKYNGEIEILKELENWKIPKFPVDGNALKMFGISGKNTGTVLNKLKEIWIQHDFNIEREKLLEMVPNLMESSPPIEKR